MLCLFRRNQKIVKLPFLLAFNPQFDVKKDFDTKKIYFSGTTANCEVLHEFIKHLHNHQEDTRCCVIIDDKPSIKKEGVEPGFPNQFEAVIKDTQKLKNEKGSIFQNTDRVSLGPFYLQWSHQERSKWHNEVGLSFDLVR